MDGTNEKADQCRDDRCRWSAARAARHSKKGTQMDAGCGVGMVVQVMPGATPSVQTVRLYQYFIHLVVVQGIFQNKSFQKITNTAFELIFYTLLFHFSLIPS